MTSYIQSHRSFMFLHRPTGAPVRLGIYSTKCRWPLLLLDQAEECVSTTGGPIGNTDQTICRVGACRPNSATGFGLTDPGTALQVSASLNLHIRGAKPRQLKRSGCRRANR